MESYDHWFTRTMLPMIISSTCHCVNHERERAMAETARSILALGADPLQVGERVIDAMLAKELYVFTDAAVAPILQARCDALLAAARGNPSH